MSVVTGKVIVDCLNCVRATLSFSAAKTALKSRKLESNMLFSCFILSLIRDLSRKSDEETRSKGRLLGIFCSTVSAAPNIPDLKSIFMVGLSIMRCMVVSSLSWSDTILSLAMILGTY